MRTRRGACLSHGPREAVHRARLLAWWKPGRRGVKRTTVRDVTGQRSSRNGFSLHTEGKQELFDRAEVFLELVWLCHIISLAFGHSSASSEHTLRMDTIG